MNLRQLIAEVLHKLPFILTVISLTIYSSFVFWFECWRYNYIAALFMCYAVRLLVTLQPRPAPPPIVDNPFEDDNEVIIIDATARPSNHQMVDFYWREAMQNYHMYQPRFDHRDNVLSGNMGHIRRPLPLSREEQLTLINHDRFYSYIDSHITVPDPWWALPYQFRVLFRHWQSVIIKSLPYDEEIFIDNVSDANYLRTDIRLRLEEFA